MRPVPSPLSCFYSGVAVLMCTAHDTRVLLVCCWLFRGVSRATRAVFTCAFFSDVAYALCCANAAAVHYCGLGFDTLRCGPLSCDRRPGDRPFSSMVFIRSVS